ncbi:MAG: vitamin K epoxide reductase family protein [Candidatus Sumerlaeaceae bacterium]
MAARKSYAYNSKIPFYVIEFLGFALSSYLFMVSANLIGDKLPCARSKWIACESAVKGPFSHFGPFSVAALGVIYYIIHLALTSGLRDRAAQILKVLLVIGGLLFVAWLRSLEIVWLKKLCPWCWGVAALTLIHAGISYRLAAPPLPRLRPPAVAGLIIGGFLLLVGLVTMLELGVKTGQLMLNQARSTKAAAPAHETNEETVEKPPHKSTAPKTPAVTSPTPAPTPVTPQQSPTPTPRPTVALPAEPELVDTPDVAVLRNRGWRHAASGEDVVKYVKLKPPVLMIAYDPYCEQCHELITTVLDTTEITKLPVTRVAIQESMLSGQVNGMVKEMPTLLLFGSSGEVLWTHVGKISIKDLVEAIRSALAAAATTTAAP